MNQPLIYNKNKITTIFTLTRIIITTIKIDVFFLTKNKLIIPRMASTFIYLRVTPAELLYAGISR